MDFREFLNNVEVDKKYVFVYLDTDDPNKDMYDPTFSGHLDYLRVVLVATFGGGCYQLITMSNIKTGTRTYFDDMSKLENVEIYEEDK